MHKQPFYLRLARKKMRVLDFTMQPCTTTILSVAIRRQRGGSTRNHETLVFWHSIRLRFTWKRRLETISNGWTRDVCQANVLFSSGPRLQRHFLFDYRWSILWHGLHATYYDNMPHNAIRQQIWHTIMTPFLFFFLLLLSFFFFWQSQVYKAGQRPALAYDYTWNCYLNFWCNRPLIRPSAKSLGISGWILLGKCIVRFYPVLCLILACLHLVQ